MKHFCYLILLVILACPAQGEPTRGASEDPNNWFYQVQPLSGKGRTVKAPTVAEHQRAATQPKAAKAEKDVRVIPPHRPKRKTVQDTRKIDVTMEARDKRQVYDRPAVAQKAEARTAVSHSPYKKSLFDGTGKDPNYRDQSKSNGGGVYSPVPKPKTRRHGLADWP